MSDRITSVTPQRAAPSVEASPLLPAQEKSRSWDLVWLLVGVVTLPLMIGYGLDGLLPGPLKGRVQPVDLVFGSFAIILIWEMLWGKRKLRLPPGSKVIAGYLIVYGMAMWASDSRLVSGVELMVQLYLAGLLLLLCQVVTTRQRLVTLLRWWVLSAAAVAVVGLTALGLAVSTGIATPFVQHYVELMGGQYRLVGSMHLPNMAFSYLMVSSFLAVGLWALEPEGRRRRWWVASAGLLVVAALATVSRGVAGLGLGLLVTSFAMAPRRALRVARVVAGIALLGFIIFSEVSTAMVSDLSISFSSPEAVATLRDEPSKDRWFSMGSDFDDQQRRRIVMEVRYFPARYLHFKTLGLRMVRAHPWLGVGPGRFMASINRFTKPPERMLPNMFQAGDPHSTYFGALAETGFLGLGALLALLVVVGGWLRRAFRKIPRGHPWRVLLWALAGALSGYALFGLNVDLMNMRWLWLLFGLVAVVSSLVSDGQAEPLVATASPGLE